VSFDAIAHPFNPLRLIVWGGLLLPFDVGPTILMDSGEYFFDILNDTVGMRFALRVALLSALVSTLTHLGLAPAATAWRRVSMSLARLLGLTLALEFVLTGSLAHGVGIATLVWARVTLVLFFVATSQFTQATTRRILEMP
jgi:hypothetical protein